MQIKTRYFKNSFIYLFFIVLGLRCWEGFSLVAMRGLLIAVASFVVEHGLQLHGFQ